MFRRLMSGLGGFLSSTLPPLENPSVWVFLSLTAIVLGIHHLFLLCPRLPWLPGGDDANSFLRTLWQVHAAVVALSVVVVTIFVTVLANQGDRNRTWRLYSERTKIIAIIWLNLIMLGAEGLAVLQANEVSSPIFSVGYVENFILPESLFFVISLTLFGWLFKETLNFLDDDYVESLAEGRIISRMAGAVDADLDHQRRRRESLISRGTDEGDRL